jgi:hypothetical protein
MILQDFVFFGTKKGADPYKCRRIDKAGPNTGGPEPFGKGPHFPKRNEMRGTGDGRGIGLGHFESFRLYDHGEEIMEKSI